MGITFYQDTNSDTSYQRRLFYLSLCYENLCSHTRISLILILDRESKTEPRVYIESWYLKKKSVTLLLDDAGSISHIARDVIWTSFLGPNVPDRNGMF